MKRLLPLLALLFAAPAFAQLTPVYCVQATTTVCTTVSNPGNHYQGDPAWLFGGKVNAIGNQLGLFSNQPANEVIATPSGASGIPGVRALVGADIPPINLAGGNQNGGVAGPLPASDLSTSGMTAGSYTNTNITVDQYGRVTAAANGTGGGGGGSITGITLTLPSWLTVTGSPCSSGSCVLAVSGTTGQTANEFLATPNGSSGAVGLRAIVAADLPGTISSNTSGTSAGLTSYPILCTGSQFSQGLSSGSNNCATPSGSGITLQTGGTNNSSQTTLNLVGTGGVGVSNPSGGTVDIGPITEPVTQESGTSYTVDSTWCGTNRVFTNGSAIAVSLPELAGCQIDFSVQGAGTLTITPSAGNINGASSAVTVATNRQCTLNYDSTDTNWALPTCTALVSGGGGTTPKDVFAWFANSVAQATTNYLSPGINAASTADQIIQPFNGTFKNLYVHTGSLPPSGQTFTYTLYVGAFGSPAATALTCQITSTSSNNTCSDTTDTVSITAAQVWTLQLVTSATSGSTANIYISFELDPQ